MGINRIVRRNLQRAGDVQHVRGEKRWMRVWINGVRRFRKITSKAWIDVRLRDKFGYLAGHCSQVAKGQRDLEEQKWRLFGR
jgi:hypothetical protein